MAVREGRDNSPELKLQKRPSQAKILYFHLCVMSIILCGAVRNVKIMPEFTLFTCGFVEEPFCLAELLHKQSLVDSIGAELVQHALLLLWEDIFSSRLDVRMRLSAATCFLSSAQTHQRLPIFPPRMPLKN